MRDRSSRERKREREASLKPWPQNTGPRRPGLTLALLILVAVGATLFAHWPALSARALFFDDNQYLTSNRLVQNPSWASAGQFLREVLRPSTVAGYYQPLTMISLMLDYALAGQADNLRVFHRTSLTLHVANTVLVIVLLYMLFGQPWVAAMVGLLFGVHPMTVETIPWIAERKTLLATFFALWSLIVYVRYARRQSWKLYLTCLVMYVLALLSKPTSTPLPVVMLLMDFWPLNRLSKRGLSEKIPLLVLSLFAAVITVISQGQTASVEIPNKYPADRIPLILSHNIIFYLYKIVWPVRLTPYYPFPQPLALSDPMVLAGVIGTCILIPALLISLRWTRALLTGWLIFFVAIFPTMGILGFTVVIASDKYAYLPAVGLLFILGWLLNQAWSAGTNDRTSVRRAGIVAATLMVACPLVAVTRHQVHRWQTTIGLYDYAVTLAPAAPYLYNNRGFVLIGKGENDQAIRDCTLAIKLAPAYTAAYRNRSVAFIGKEEYPQAIRDASRAIELKPDDVGCYLNRGTAYGRMGDYDRAIQDLSKAIELNPEIAECHRNLGNAYLGKGDYERAIRDYTEAIRLKPADAAAYGNRGVAYSALKQYDKAWADVKMCKQLGGTPGPDFVRNLIESTGRTE